MHLLYLVLANTSDTCTVCDSLRGTWNVNVWFASRVKKKKGRKEGISSVIIIPVKYNKRCKAVPFVGLVSCVQAGACVCCRDPTPRA